MINIIKNILNRENIVYTNISKVSSGFTNAVYFVDDYVIKLTNDKNIVKKLLKEISIYKNIKLKNIPSYITSGFYEDWCYLIISKIKGKSLYSIWHTISKEKRIMYIQKISNIIKNFNNLNADFLPDDFKFNDWGKYIQDKLNDIKTKLDNLGIITCKITNLLKQKDLFNSNNKYGLVYNDAHFDNFLVDEYDNIYLIDFDRVIYAPIDYEMLIFKTMCENPSKFANEIDEKNIYMSDYSFVYSKFKKFYPEMFSNILIGTRIKIYQFIYLCNQCLNHDFKIEKKCEIENLIKKYL